MKRLLPAMLAVIAAMPAQAQVQPPGGIIVDQSPYPQNVYGNGDALVGGPGETPTMRRQKLAWTIALRDEASAWRARDGGVLSDRHARAIRRKLAAIRNPAQAGPGALAPLRD